MAETLASSGRITLAVALSRLFGLVREIIFASLFGASAIADAFQVAFRLPNLLRDLFAEGALSSAFVPTFSETLIQQDRQQAYRLANLVLSLLLVITGSLVLAGTIWSTPLIATLSGNFAGDQAKLELASQLARIMMPFLCMVSVAAVWMGILNAQKRYAAPAYAPLVFNLVSIVSGLLLLGLDFSAIEAIRFWSAATLAGGFSQAIVQFPSLWRLGYRPIILFRGFWRHPGLKRIAKLMLPAIWGVAAVQLNLFINTRFASDLGDGPVAQLNYAFRLFFLPVGMFSVAISVVTTTRVSEEAAKGSIELAHRRAAEGLSAIAMLMVPSAIGLFILAEPIIKMVFERGAFTPQATQATAAVLQAYALALVPYGFIKSLSPLYYAIQRPSIPLIGSTVAVAINLVFNAMTYRQLGAPGLALGTGLGACANYLILRMSCQAPMRAREDTNKIREFLALVAGNTLLALMVGGLWQAKSQFASSMPWLETSIAESLSLIFLVTVAGIAYILALGRMQYPGAQQIAQLPKNIKNRLFRSSKPN